MTHNSVCVHGKTHVGGRLCPECAESTFICDKGYAHVGGALLPQVQRFPGRRLHFAPQQSLRRHRGPCERRAIRHLYRSRLPAVRTRLHREHLGERQPSAADEYEDYVRSRPDLMAKLPDLKGKRLGCWHREPRKGCHADVLVKLVNELCGDE
jgi:hypothetical protein